MKVCAATAALACAGGGFFVDHAGSGAASTPAVAPVTLDHYLCTGDSRHGGCDPTTEALPNGTSFGINNPNDNLTCTPGRGQLGPVTGPVSITNEFSSTPVPLAVGRRFWSCSLLPAVQFGNNRSRTVPVPLATFTCSAAGYESRSSARFTPPFPVTLGNNMSVRVLDPAVLCVQTGAAAGAASMNLVCFQVRVVNDRRRFWEPVFGLCVPGLDPPASGTTTSSPTTTTSTTIKATTTTSTTVKATTSTTIKPTTTTASTTTSTTSSTTTSTTTTPTTPPPSSTTTTTSGTQPCPGMLINGVCIVNV